MAARGGMMWTMSGYYPDRGAYLSVSSPSGPSGHSGAKLASDGRQTGPSGGSKLSTGTGSNSSYSRRPLRRWTPEPLQSSAFVWAVRAIARLIARGSLPSSRGMTALRALLWAWALGWILMMVASLTGAALAGATLGAQIRISAVAQAAPSEEVVAW